MSRAGLLMIQVDGLSRSQLERALAEGRMPFLARLIRRERYRIHTLYSGLPSSTPAFQGELFYGVKSAVPAFGFRDPVSRKLVSMLHRGPSQAVESKLAHAGTPLLAGGSAYCDIYSGGAREAHFCPARLSLTAFLPSAGQLGMLRLVAVHARAFVLAAVLSVVELVLALQDAARGVLAGEGFSDEALFVGTRVATAVVLRELAVAGASLDLVRGLPVIHINLLGYDEQAHRRGPSSLFARWALSGIDRAIARLWDVARRSTARDYQLWIYSDHGQEETRPFARVTGRTLRDVLAETLGHDPTFIAKGPVGHVYLPRPLSADREAAAARRLVALGVPLVLARSPGHSARAYVPRGAFDLPEQAGEVLGRDHPFLDEAALDLVALCHQERAGDLVVCGFHAGGPHLSFPEENGSHAGPGPEETRAFALLPAPVTPERRGRAYLRPLDLREAALAALGRRQGARKPGTLRIVTYNIHGCRGIDGVLSTDRVARVIAAYEPDVVALQEVDVGRARTGGVDQAHELAERLRMRHHFHPVLQVAEERYGDAILSAYPTRVVRAGRLPGPRHLAVEPRGALWVAVRVGALEVQLINTHFGLLPGERLAQARALAGTEWLAHPECSGPVVLCGDFNSTPGSPAYRALAGQLADAQVRPGHRARPTWFSACPVSRIDHVFVGGGLSVRDVQVAQGQLAVLASDHLPVVVEVQVA